MRRAEVDGNADPRSGDPDRHAECGAAVGVATAPGHGASYTVAVGTGTVNGKPTRILVDAKGAALYSLTSDKESASACTGDCAQIWPPLLCTATPTGASSLPGRLTVLHTANGAQAAYNGHLLYRYAGDTRPGQVHLSGGDDHCQRKYDAHRLDEARLQRAGEKAGT